MKLAVLSKATYRFQAVPIKIPVLFSEIENSNWIDKIILSKKKKKNTRGDTILDFKL